MAANIKEQYQELQKLMNEAETGRKQVCLHLRYIKFVDSLPYRRKISQVVTREHYRTQKQRRRKARIVWTSRQKS